MVYKPSPIFGAKSNCFYVSLICRFRNKLTLPINLNCEMALSDWTHIKNILNRFLTHQYFGYLFINSCPTFEPFIYMFHFKLYINEGKSPRKKKRKFYNFAISNFNGGRGVKGEKNLSPNWIHICMLLYGKKTKMKIYNTWPWLRVSIYCKWMAKLWPTYILKSTQNVFPLNIYIRQSFFMYLVFI